MIEIMIAISIFAMVMIAIYSSWSSVMRGARTGMAAAAEVQRTRVATRALEEALASAIMYVDNAKYYHFSTDTSGDNAYITFVARLPSTFPGSGLFGDQTVRRVCFYVENGNLMLSQGPIMEATKKIGKPYTIALAPGVTLFDMEFYDGMARKWFAEWISTNQLPKMARLAISFSPNPGLRKAESMTLRTIPLGGFAITRAGAGVTGGSGNGLAPGMLNNRRTIAPPPGGFAGGPKDDDLWSAYLPPNFRAGGKFGSKERSSLFPPE
jgi:type II secretion system protein J